MKKRILSILLAMVMCMTLLPTVAMADGTKVAEIIGGTQYETLAEAVANATDGATIRLLADCTGKGIQIEKEKFKTEGLTIDLNGKTFTANEPVGSSGTKNQAMQLNKDNIITIKNGTITTAADKASSFKFIIQNYSNLTLDRVVLDGANLGLENITHYVLSNNNGNTVLKNGTRLLAKAGDVAFDIFDYATGGYDGVSVKIADASVVVQGLIEIGGNRTGESGNKAEFTPPTGYSYSVDENGKLTIGLDWPVIEEKIVGGVVVGAVVVGGVIIGTKLVKHAIDNAKAAKAAEAEAAEAAKLAEMPTVAIGDSGDAVTTLQTELNALGYDCGEADGFFGQNTLNAVLAFQTANGLDADGVVGAQTWAALL